MRPFPGAVAELCGVTVEDFTLIKGTVPAAKLQWNGASERLQEGTSTAGFNEVLYVEHPDVQVVAEYTSEYYAGSPALIKRTVGQGQVWYYGAAYNEPVVDALLDEIELSSPVGDLVEYRLKLNLVSVPVRIKLMSFYSTTRINKSPLTLRSKQKSYCQVQHFRMRSTCPRMVYSYLRSICHIKKFIHPCHALYIERNTKNALQPLQGVLYMHDVMLNTR